MTSAGSFGNLRRLARRRSEPELLERCELCGAPIPDDHRHLYEERSGTLACVCQACALLFTGTADQRFRPVPNRILSLPGLRLGDDWWESLQIPVGLAFFTRSSQTGRVVARYPSPAGPTSSQLPLTAWDELEAANPILRTLEPDVEALLVNRVAPPSPRVGGQGGGPTDNLVVPIDRCYALVGLVRAGWRGISGGTDVWAAVAAFFAALRERAEVVDA